MSFPEGPGAARPFSLETDDRTDEERKAQSRHGVKEDFLGSVLPMGPSKRPKAPMDTDYQEELEVQQPKIKYNLNFYKAMKGMKVTEEEMSNRFDLKKLFQAAARGDVTMLDGLHDYLTKNLKKLSHSEYQSYGKNPLLKALLNLKDEKNDTVEYLLNIAEQMGDVKEFVNAAYTDSYYNGQSALHIAIERRSLHYVKLLVSKGTDVHAKACGKFFQLQHGPSFYFGELPLSLAACTNQKNIVDFLMENEYQRAKVEERDSLGNTVLHALVVVDDKDQQNTEFIVTMYDHILTNTARLYPNLKLEDIENKHGLTPIKLAAKMGKIGVFEHILHREFHHQETKHLSRKFTEWAYGPVHSSLYDLDSLDSYENNSVLKILVYGSDIPNRHKMLQIEPLNKLLEEKWERFAAQIFFSNFLVYVFFVSVFTVTSYNRREGKPPFYIQHTREGYIHLAGQIWVALTSVYLFIGGAVLYIISSVLDICGREEYLGFLVLCLALSWINLLYFSRGCKHMGIYSVMIQKMIISDIMRFLFVYIVFLFGFSADSENTQQDETVVTLLVEPPAKNTTAISGRTFYTESKDETCTKVTFESISYTTLELFKFTIGMGDLEFTENYKYKEVFYVLLISYIVLTYILLFNMLIALMSGTVAEISKDSASIWKLQRAITILDLERSLLHCLRRRFRSGVEKDLSSEGEWDPESEQKKDIRRCFRVEEVNWDKWNTNLTIINEDPGSCDSARQPPTINSPRETTRTWRGILRDVSRRRQRPRRRQFIPESREMSTLSASHV
ncbi:transient receptor potential cation channel subfamily V member 1 isoform X3 [Hypomesus transpacificus]|uniref:transient receptor potential cation channel subfamily V member 1 isoform X3 n=1 Tax=Hypomesus transpacificus TaxID=137520 RepID=UPI001F07E170|nr:transient receptor potential cation channel subfamily V member 1 isoform X3 [Hypomesus transpacificus]